MDDEKYFIFYSDRIPGNDGFYTDNIDTCPDEVRYKGIEKCPKLMLVWIAISERGFSEVFVQSVNAPAINQDIYLEECLLKRLKAFIDKYHSNRKYLFWPDLASAHAMKVLCWLDENVNYKNTL